MEKAARKKRVDALKRRIDKAILKKKSVRRINKAILKQNEAEAAYDRDYARTERQFARTNALIATALAEVEAHLAEVDADGAPEAAKDKNDGAASGRAANGHRRRGTWVVKACDRASSYARPQHVRASAHETATASRRTCASRLTSSLCFCALSAVAFSIFAFFLSSAS